MNIIDWLVDTMARTETLDLAFTISDLVDIPQSERERAAMAEGDSMASGDFRAGAKIGRIDPMTGKPWGKSVR